MTSYCTYCISHPEDSFNRNYHDTQYGFPLNDDNALFERLVLEINQAGLSWITKSFGLWPISFRLYLFSSRSPCRRPRRAGNISSMMM
jgi:hypothetical protein